MVTSEDIKNDCLLVIPGNLPILFSARSRGAETVSLTLYSKLFPVNLKFQWEFYLIILVGFIFV